MSNQQQPQQYKPKACNNNCGKDIVFEQQQDGKWLPYEFDVENWVKLERHKCPNYQPKPKPFENRGEGTNWAGTNKQGQMFEARVHKELDRTEATNGTLINKKLDDLLRLTTQILFILKTPDIKLTDEEVKKIAGAEKIDEEKPSLRTSDKEDDYGF